MADLRARRPSGDQGFSLIEVMVVVAIGGILAAIAIPAFQSMVQNLQESSTRSDLSSNRTVIAAWQLDNNGLLPAAGRAFDPGPAGLDLTSYGWSQGSDTVSFVYSTNTGTNPTAFCLQATSVDSAVYRVSTKTPIAVGTCDALGRSNY